MASALLNVSLAENFHFALHVFFPKTQNVELEILILRQFRGKSAMLRTIISYAGNLQLAVEKIATSSPLLS